MPNLNTPVNAFSFGNQNYKLATNTGRAKIFTTPDDLWAAACTYFDWCVSNPIIECRYYGIDAKLIELPKMRAMSLQGLSIYIGVCNLRYYKKLADFSPIVEKIYDVIYSHNFCGAAVGLIKPCIIWRSLGWVNSNVK